ncbi:hypothetical protein HDE_04855 [Halotydeus destructor]|nr:hypothetical protein HDE_04855 [Halotydeus destructor]
MKLYSVLMLCYMSNCLKGHLTTGIHVLDIVASSLRLLADLVGREWAPTGQDANNWSTGRSGISYECQHSINQTRSPFLLQCLASMFNDTCNAQEKDPEKQDLQETHCALACYKYKPDFLLASDAPGNTGCASDEDFDDACVCGVPLKGTLAEGLMADFLKDKDYRKVKYAQVFRMLEMTRDTDNYDRKVAEAKQCQAERARAHKGLPPACQVHDVFYIM